jgi:putative acetyltransferase
VSGALEVRPGREEDADAIRAVHVAAFAPSKVEAEIFDGLRADGDLVPSLSFAALRDGAVVGHVAISRAWVDRDDDGGTAEALGLGPIGVPPALQRAGVGGALMRAALAAARETAFPLIALLGHVEYYPRFGFEPAAPLGLRCPYPVTTPHWMAYRLPAYDPALRGAFRYASAFARA